MRILVVGLFAGSACNGVGLTDLSTKFDSRGTKKFYFKGLKLTKLQGVNLRNFDVFGSDSLTEVQSIIIKCLDTDAEQLRSGDPRDVFSDLKSGFDKFVKTCKDSLRDTAGPPDDPRVESEAARLFTWGLNSIFHDQYIKATKGKLLKSNILQLLKPVPFLRVSKPYLTALVSDYMNLMRRIGIEGSKMSKELVVDVMVYNMEMRRNAHFKALRDAFKVQDSSNYLQALQSYKEEAEKSANGNKSRWQAIRHSLWLSAIAFPDDPRPRVHAK